MLIARFDFQIDKLSESSCIAIGVLVTFILHHVERTDIVFF